MNTVHVPMTTDEFLQLTSTPHHTQLIAGVVVTADHEPGWWHRLALLQLGMQFTEHTAAHPVVGAMRLVHDRRALAAHLWWTPGERPAVPDVPHALPALVVSVPEHAHLARAAGHEMWVVDGDADTVTVHRADTDPVVHGDTVTTPLIPGWVVDLAEMFRR